MANLFQAKENLYAQDGSHPNALGVEKIVEVLAQTIRQDGIKNVNPQFFKAAKTMGIKGQKLYFKVVLPAALPMIVSGMKQGWSFAWRALMAGEMLVGTKGLGYILMVGRDLADISQVVAVMIVIILLGILIEKLVFVKIESNLRDKWGLNKD